MIRGYLLRVLPGDDTVITSDASSTRILRLHVNVRHLLAALGTFTDFSSRVGPS